MNIPSSLTLLGKEITVTIVASADWKEHDAVGFYNSQTGEIHILRAAQQLMEHTFFHELMHAVLTAMGRDKLSQDEAFVDMASGLIHQAMTTAKSRAKPKT